MAAAGSGLHRRDGSLAARVVGTVTVVVVTTGTDGGGVGGTATDFGPDPDPRGGWVVVGVVGGGTVVGVATGTVGAPGAGFDPAPGPWAGRVVVVVGAGRVVVVTTGTVGRVVGGVGRAPEPPVGPVGGRVGGGTVPTCGVVPVASTAAGPEGDSARNPVAVPSAAAGPGRVVARSSTAVAVNPTAEMSAAAVTTAMMVKRSPRWILGCGAPSCSGPELCPNCPPSPRGWSGSSVCTGFVGAPDSTARLTRGVPWFCVPPSRRVCLCRAGAPKMRLPKPSYATGPVTRCTRANRGCRRTVIVPVGPGWVCAPRFQTPTRGPSRPRSGTQRRVAHGHQGHEHAARR